MKEFNTTAVCIPSKHYMVDLGERLVEIRKLVDAGKYFTINRARQYGKTTTLVGLARFLEDSYEVISLDFQRMGEASFRTEEDFVYDFCKLILTRREAGLKLPQNIEKKMFGGSIKKLFDLFEVITQWCRCSDKKIVLIIDEVDCAGNNQVFMDFLSQLRSGYISRDADGLPALHSVILSGVTDIKHLKSGMRDETEARQNSPWNIAADFDVDMSLSVSGIRGMLDEYENDHGTGMDTAQMAEEIRAYTNGYPFLVSRICQLIDTRIVKETGIKTAWSRQGIDEAVKYILSENSTLFQSLSAKLKNYPSLKTTLYSILIEGIKVTWSSDQEDIEQLQMYGFIRKEDNAVKIDNRIFETRLYNLFLSEEELRNSAVFREGELAKNRFVRDGELDMQMILEQFAMTYIDIFGPLKDRFKERDGREQFLLYLKPIINGTGNYYIEAQTRDQTRTDVIVDYLGKQYIIELKIWRGERYNAEGERQISEYLDHFRLKTGYMLSFNFNKKKESGMKRVEIGDKVLFECTV